MKNTKDRVKLLEVLTQWNLTDNGHVPTQSLRLQLVLGELLLRDVVAGEVSLLYYLHL